MNKFYTLSFTVLTVCCLWACSKGGSSNNSTTNTNNKNVVGHWLTVNDHLKIYSLTNNALVKDTTFSFQGVYSSLADVFIFNGDGTAYVTDLPHGVGGKTGTFIDTSSYLHYSVTGNKLNYTEDGDDADKYAFQIVSVTSTNLTMEDTYTSIPNTDWGLNMQTTYKVIDDTYYSKQ